MRVILIAMIAALSASQLFAEESKSVETYGDKITISNPISIEYAINHLNELNDQEILITGTVSKVCEKKGCWMVLKDAKNSIRITFNNYQFFVPKTIVGKSAHAQGKLHEELMDISEAKHFAQDAGQSSAEIQRIKKKVKEYRFIATAVEIAS